MRNSEKEKNTTVLGKETVFSGLMKFTDDLTIEGSFTGSIDAKGVLYIAKSAVCKVDYIKAASITVEGKVYGSLNALGDVDLRSKSIVQGDIVAGRLKIADDVSFDGVIHMAGNTSLHGNDVFSLDISQLKSEVQVAPFEEAGQGYSSNQML